MITFLSTKYIPASRNNLKSDVKDNPIGLGSLLRRAAERFVHSGLTMSRQSD
jgi:hypothetical protein